MKKFKVWVNFQGGYYTEVEAENRDRAIDIANKEADAMEVDDWDVDLEVDDNYNED